jgi:uncharacterized protein (TIGR00296 family)
MFSDDDGKRAVEIARAVVERHVRRERMPEFDVPAGFREKSGVFVTLTTFPDDDLRGCIGFPEPVEPLIDALVDSAVSAASRDPRFHSVRPEELDGIKIEVSLLTPPEELVPEKTMDLPGMILVGEDGLIVQRNGLRGLLLPQVPIEQGWGPDEFLSHACMKAGLSPDSWLMPGTKVFRFKAEVFSETNPRGEVVRRNLSEHHGCSG